MFCRQNIWIYLKKTFVITITSDFSWWWLVKIYSARHEYRNYSPPFRRLRNRSGSPSARFFFLDFSPNSNSSNRSSAEPRNVAVGRVRIQRKECAPASCAIYPGTIDRDLRAFEVGWQMFDVCVFGVFLLLSPHWFLVSCSRMHPVMPLYVAQQQDTFSTLHPQ